ncbi:MULTISPECIES: transcriptional regulator Spx [unclassified Enterococcus]|uniref:transcriptional regulator Spx n=1 Tax=unclassified Enterococcus TaxID=2608891 RepID=UPI000353082A|nr:regulatory protein spx [Enterococcus faecalis 13-SD-W-01]
MLVLYVSPSCTTCRKARAWLNAHDIPFEERNIFAEPLNKNELKAILAVAENGTDDIISIRSKVFQKLNVDIDELSMFQLLQLMEVYPSLIRRPLIVAENALQVGYNEEEFRRFLPRSVRKVKFRKAQLIAGLYQKEFHSFYSI